MRTIKDFCVFATMVLWGLVVYLSPAAAQGEGFYYTIQKGDTLWDLSQKFYNSQWDWPGLWEQNREVKNPHWIYPGNKIQIFLKKQPPVSMAAATPPPAPLPDPVQFVYFHMDYVSFIRPTPMPGLGTVISSEDNHQMISPSERLFIQPDKMGLFKPGETYLVYTTRNIGKKLNASGHDGFLHLIKARIRILEDHGPSVLARVEHGIRDVSSGDKIMSYTPSNPKISVVESPPPIHAELICSEDNLNMINDYTLAFIDKGRADNVHPGQIRTIAQSTTETNKSFFAKKSIPLSPLRAGKAIVLKAEKDTATVMVLSSNRDIHPGDGIY